MVGVEKALRDSIGLLKSSPSFFVPHLIEMVLDLLVLVSMVFTIMLAIGVHVEDLIVDDPYFLLDQISVGGFGLIAIILLTFLFSLFLILIVKAGALAWVVGMTKRSSAGEKADLSSAFEDVRRHTFDILLYWGVQTAILFAIFIIAFIPAVVLTLIGLSGTLAVVLTLFTMLIAFVLALVLIVGLLFTPQYVVVSKSGVFASMKKSMGFVKDNIGAVAIYIAVVIVFVFFISLFNVITSFIPDIFSGFSYFLGVAIGIFLFVLRLGVGLVVAPYFEMVKTMLVMDQGADQAAGPPSP